jgi:gamma-glutamylcyclotransferase (GGCT)/AIG2-like uncharacterized protein YtfP
MTIVKEDKKIDTISTPTTDTTARVAVYGSLREGLHNHSVLGKNPKLLGTFETEPLYTMFSVGGSFPALVEGGTTSIIMEVYEISLDQLENVNALEGFNVNFNKEDNMYLRKILHTPYGEAFGYIWNDNTEGLHMVESGDWFKFKTMNNVVNKATC